MEHFRETVSLSNVHCPSCVAYIQDSVSSIDVHDIGVRLERPAVSVLTGVLTYDCVLLEAAGDDGQEEHLHHTDIAGENGLEEQRTTISRTSSSPANSLRALIPHGAQSRRGKQQHRQRKITARSSGRARREEARRRVVCSLEGAGYSETTTTSDGELERVHTGASVSEEQRDHLAALRPASSSRSSSRGWFGWLESTASRERREREEAVAREQEHLARCGACREARASRDQGAGDSGTTLQGVSIEGGKSEQKWTRTTLELDGLTCASCVGAVQGALDGLAKERSGDAIKDRTVSLIPQRATVTHDARLISAQELAEAIEDAGYDATVATSDEVVKEEVWHETTLEVDGMTCASCVGAIIRSLDPATTPGLRSFTLTLVPPLARATHDPSKLSVGQLVEEIEDLGYDAKVVDSKKQGVKEDPRRAKVRIDGMFCEDCSRSLAKLFDEQGVQYTSFTHLAPETTLTYIPSPPDGLTLRSLKREVEERGPFTLHPISSLGASFSNSPAARKEARLLAARVAIAFLFVIPTFVIGVVGMGLLSSTHPFREYWEVTLVGGATRGTIALFVLATPVQFGVGSVFYERAFHTLRAVWRPGRSWIDRALRWGSMDTLVVLGTTVAWCASVAYMGIDMASDTRGEMGYFDTSVFLVFFILVGRLLESLSRRKTGDAIDQLASMKPQEGTLQGGDKVRVEMIERGDMVVVPSGAAVPLDGVITDGATSFDESSLTGESKPVAKGAGDEVFGGTTNVGSRPVVLRVTRGPGASMIDGIVSIVRDAMARKSDIEQLADRIVGYFVPVIIAGALLTFVIWIIRGYAGDLPKSWLGDSSRQGGWVLFAVQFAVATLVVACPCGIGLAAPTAQMVGIGLAAKMGIVPYGGGEAFQNATSIDAVVFDKTGTLTLGTFAVTDEHVASDAALWETIARVEETSSHPIATALREYAAQRAKENKIELGDVEEVAGRGLVATVDGKAVLIGNELLLSERAPDANVPNELVHRWTGEAKSVILVALDGLFAAAFAVQDPPRPESSSVVETLKRRGVVSYMCTGDNERTARAVASSVGINAENVIAGVLPTGKRDAIVMLQRGGAHDAVRALASRRSWWERRRLRRGARCRVAFIGDGVNDGPPLATADVGISMGTGSALAITSSDYCLLSSHLGGVVTVLALARATFFKILTNFAWAAVFNLCLVPVAAGAFYDLGQASLPPVWASLAMALSSVSVVTNALSLRLTFRAPKLV